MSLGLLLLTLSLAPDTQLSSNEMRARNATLRRYQHQHNLCYDNSRKKHQLNCKKERELKQYFVSRFGYEPIMPDR